MNIATIRRQLETRKAELAGRLEHITEDVRHAERLPADFADQATQLENDDVLVNLDDATRMEIQQIQSALERIAADRYGICDTCQKPIETRRLEALPCATRCIKCASKSSTN